MKAKKLPVGLRVLFGILSVVLCVALFATSVLAMVLADARVLTSEDSLQVIVRYVVFGTESKKNPPAIAPQAAGGMRLDEAESEEELTEIQKQIVGTLYDMFSEYFEEEVPFTEKEVEELLEQSTLPDFISEKMAGIMTDIYTGEFNTTVTGQEILELMEENADLIQDTLGFEMPEEYKTEIADWVDQLNITDMVQDLVLGEVPGVAPENGGNNPEGDGAEDSENASGGDRYEGGHGGQSEIFADGVINGLLSGKGTVEDVIDGGVFTILQALREVTAVEMLLIVLGACLLLIALLFVVNLKQIYVAVRCVGITAMLAALPFAIATVVAFAMPALFADEALHLIYLALTLTAGVAFGVFGGGLVLVIVSVFLTARFKKNLVTPKAIPVVVPPVVPDLPVWNTAPVAQEVPVVTEIAQEAPVEEAMPVMEEDPAEAEPAAEETVAAEPEQV